MMHSIVKAYIIITQLWVGSSANLFRGGSDEGSDNGIEEFAVASSNIFKDTRIIGGNEVRRIVSRGSLFCSLGSNPIHLFLSLFRRIFVHSLTRSHAIYYLVVLSSISFRLLKTGIPTRSRFKAATVIFAAALSSPRTLSSPPHIAWEVLTT